MTKIGLMVCGCLLWTTVVNAQGVSPQAVVYDSSAEGRVSMNPQWTPLSTSDSRWNSGASGLSPRNTARDAEVQQTQFEDFGSGNGGQSMVPGMTDPNSYSSDSEWVDVSGLDLHGVMPYYSHLQYGSGSIKSHGDVAGVYGYASTTFDLVEVGIEETAIYFRSGFRFRQGDYTVIWNNYNIQDFRLRAGIHYMSNNDPLTNAGVIGILGAHYTQDRWEVGADYYVTNYQKYTPNLTVNQFSPRIAFPYGTAKGELRGYYIHTNSNLGLGKRDFLSLEGRMSQDIGKVNVGAYGWGGEQTFAVRNDGFVVYNLAEKHRAGFGGEASYKFTEHSKITGRIGQELFSDFTSQSKTQQTVLSLLFLHTF